MAAAGGWYVDPKKPERDAYWTGRIWSGANRPTEPGTPAFPEDGDRKSPPRPPRPSDSWRSWATTMYVLAALVVLGALIGGIALSTRTGQACTTNPYDESIVDCTDTHPFVAAGIGVIVAGLMQSLMLYVVGRLCTEQAAAADRLGADDRGPGS